MVAVIKGTPTVSRWKVFSSMAPGHLNLSRQWVTSFEPLERMEDEISGPGPLLPPLKTRLGTKSQLASYFLSLSLSFLPSLPESTNLPCTMHFTDEVTIARATCSWNSSRASSLWSWPGERPFVAWKKINRRKWGEGCEWRRMDGSNNYGEEKNIYINA